ncbi:hypothetical protein OAF54_01160 [bacterium]|nr:hypothetical protein [bacterium]
MRSATWNGAKSAGTIPPTPEYENHRPRNSRQTMPKPKTECKIYSAPGDYVVRPVEEISDVVQPGDACFTKGMDPVGAVITAFTQKYLPSGEWCPTHVEIVYEVIFGIGAVNFTAGPRGYIPRPLLRHARKGNDIQIWRRKGLTAPKKRRIKTETIRLATRDQGYGWNEAIRIGLPFLPSVRNLTHHCSEAFCLIQRKANIDLFPGQDLEKVPPSMALAEIHRLEEMEEWVLVAEF